MRRVCICRCFLFCVGVLLHFPIKNEISPPLSTWISSCLCQKKFRGDCCYLVVERLDVKKKQLRKASRPLSCIKLIFQISVSFKNESSFQSHFMPVIFPAVFIRMSFNNSLSVDSCRNTFEASSISKIGPDVLTEISLEIDLLRARKLSFVEAFTGVRKVIEHHCG